LENMKKGISYNNKAYFEFKFKLAIYNLIYLAVRNIRHIQPPNHVTNSNSE